MVDNCKHVIKVNPARDHSILNPQKWLCNVCGTTESVWACLSCPHVACGRYNEEHALNHFLDSKHPLALEVNDKYVFCYECDEYVLNDNAAGDIRLLRSALSAIATQTFTDLESRGKRILRSRTFSGFPSRSASANHLINQDKSYTALLHRRLRLLGRAFYTWRDNVWKNRPPPLPKPKPPPQAPPPPKPTPPPKMSTPSATISRKKKTMIPGVVGLRNLGNTCYMNAILQVLSSMDEFRQHFLNSESPVPISSRRSSSASATPTSPTTVRQSPRLLQRQTTMECFDQVISPLEGCIHKKGGLNGGGSGQSKAVQLAKLRQGGVQSLSHELHALFRVMWSGKWGIVSPHSMLHAVWNIIPFFKGYSQQDAQEFLTELLDKVENEMQNAKSAQSRRLLKLANNLVTSTFQGQLVSQVKCLACKNLSNTYEPFCDLSLEFPDRYQISGTYKIVSQESCNLTEMLAKFTEVEKLEGRIYACENCNSKRRRASHKPVVRTEAEKTFMINKLPKVLRLHLKRFRYVQFGLHLPTRSRRWSGRNHREKINTHVDFGEELDLSPFCSAAEEGPFLYQLSAVVIHHGRGFSSGHYTAFCWNDEAGSWVHCNDARVESCKIKEVTKSQAYILLYTRKNESVQFEEIAQALNAAPADDSGDEIILNIKSEENEQTEVVQNVLSKMCSVNEDSVNSGASGLQRCISLATDGVMTTGEMLGRLIENSDEFVKSSNSEVDMVGDREPFAVNMLMNPGKTIPDFVEDRPVLLVGGIGSVETPDKVAVSDFSAATPEKLERMETRNSSPAQGLGEKELLATPQEEDASPSKTNPTSDQVLKTVHVESVSLSETSGDLSCEMPSSAMSEKTVNSPEILVKSPEKHVNLADIYVRSPEKLVVTSERPVESLVTAVVMNNEPLTPPLENCSVTQENIVNSPEKLLESPCNVLVAHQVFVKPPNAPENMVKSPEKFKKAVEKTISPLKLSETPEKLSEKITRSPTKATKLNETTVMYPECSTRTRKRTSSQSDSECDGHVPSSPRSRVGRLPSSWLRKRSAEAEDLPERPYKRCRTTTL
ncbi:ubiquitin carboxyl-terminal hydrolase 44-like isoform X2 [Lineus longissimus]|uniref:ubiquitin carboxyl-terminal hydrolase 44-like isoform X2 n=1 Tax=Lineus longissimus TaxID=88925 RepID=UPI00315D8CBC